MNYYYLISGLPNLSLDGASPELDFEEAFDVIQRNLDPSDEILYRYLLYPNDNRNLLNVLFHRYKNFPKAGFQQPSVINEQSITDYHKYRGTFPHYMSEFLDEYEDLFRSMSVREMEDQLLEKFYEEVGSQKNEFMTNYFQFEKILKSAAAAYNQSHFGFLSQPYIGQEEPILPLAGKGKSSFNLLGEYPFLEDLKEVISTFEPHQIEKFTDRVKWQYLLDVKGFFNRESVYAYALRLMIIFRWKQLGIEKGEAHFDVLQKNIKNKVLSPKIAEI